MRLQSRVDFGVTIYAARGNWSAQQQLGPKRRLLKEIGIKSCREVRFSNGGAFFAAANNAAVQVYNSYTAENVGNLRCNCDSVRVLTGLRHVY